MKFPGVPHDEVKEKTDGQYVVVNSQGKYLIVSNEDDTFNTVAVAFTNDIADSIVEGLNG